MMRACLANLLGFLACVAALELVLMWTVAHLHFA